MGAKVNDYIIKWRKEDAPEHTQDIAFSGYTRDTYLIDADVPRFGSGEAKGIIKESVRGMDMYLHGRCVQLQPHAILLPAMTNHMSPDDHFQNLKRVIAAIGGKAQPYQRYYAIPLRKPSAQA